MKEWNEKWMKWLTNLLLNQTEVGNPIDALQIEMCCAEKLNEEINNCISVGMTVCIFTWPLKNDDLML